LKRAVQRHLQAALTDMILRGDVRDGAGRGGDGKQEFRVV